MRKFSKKRYSRYITTFPTSLFYHTGCFVRNLSKTGSREEKFFRAVMYKKRPKAFFIGCFQMLLPGILWRERHFMQKSNAKPANLENKSLALLSPNCLVAKLFTSYSICAVKLHILASLRCFPGHFHAPVVSPVTGR